MSSRINGVALWPTATTIDATAVVTSNVVDMRESLGDAVALEITLAGTTVDVNISLEVSGDGVTFYTPYDSSGSLGAVKDAATATLWYQHTPPLAPYIRFKATGDGSNGANTTIIAILFKQSN